MMSQNLQKGFTLIELLVVIAIIGALSSVVLAALNSSRNKAANAAIKSNLNNARAQAAIYQETCGSYNAGSCAGGWLCMNSTLGVAKFLTSIQSVNGNVSVECNREITNGTAYAIQSVLKTPENGYTYWCVDSKGASEGVTSVQGVLNGGYSCP